MIQVSLDVVRRLFAAPLRWLGQIRDPLTRGWALVSLGSMARLAISLVASVLIARALGPAGFGSYVMLGVLASIAGVVADMGLTAAAVRSMAAGWQEQPERTREQGRALLWLRLAAALVVLLPGAALASPLARALGVGQPVLVPLALVGVVLLALSGSVSGMLQAVGSFGHLALLGVVNAVLTTLLALLLFLAGQLTLVSALLVLGSATTLACFLLGRRLLPAPWRLGFPGWRQLERQARLLLRSGRWLWLSNLLEVLALQLDVFLVNRWSAPATLGLYVLALNLSSKAQVVNQSLYTVLMPATAVLKGRQGVERYLWRGLRRSLPVALCLLALLPLAPWLVASLYGAAYAPAAHLLQALLLVVLFELFTTPLVLLLYGLNQPRRLALVNSGQLATLLLSAAWLIPAYGPFGAVLARFATKLLGAALVINGLLRTDYTEAQSKLPLQG